MFRAIALSLALLVGIGTIVPIATDMAEAGPKKSRKKRTQVKRYKKYSRAWWRQYHARKKRNRTLAARKRALRLRQLRLARKAGQEKSKPATAKDSKQQLPPITATTSTSPVENTPSGWRPAQLAPAELQFRIDNAAGDQVGSASISVVGPAMSGVPDTRKTLGGVATSSLRREVIDRMIRENGWVVNDYQREIAGQPVYVVVAQSQARNGSVQSRMFYFTEVDGRIYSVATNSPAQEADRLAEESEKVINSLKTRVRPAQRASN